MQSANIWAVAISVTAFACELSLPKSANDGFFRVEFDLTEEVETPSAV